MHISSKVNTGKEKIIEKIQTGSRINTDECILLYENSDFNELGNLAFNIKKNLHSDTCTYLINRYINYSNICTLSCKFCSFAAKSRSPHAFTYSIDEIVNDVSKSTKNGITEVHMVGGLHPDLDKNYYLTLLQEIKKVDKNIHIKAFTAVEILHLANNIFKDSLQNTIEILKKNGLDSLTGGGAEILDDEIRKKICRGKETTNQWLDVHKEWHKQGNFSTCTMLYGHVEDFTHRINHLNLLRELQDETNGFTGFIPLIFIPNNTRLSNVQKISAQEQLKTLAISRIFLDNIKNLTAYWIGMGLPLASIALNYGVNDLHGTIEDEKIFHMAGANTPEFQTKKTLSEAITNSGFVPKQRNSHYKII